MRISKSNLPLVKGDRTEIPEKSLFELPEKVLQFGTGVLLRGLCDYFVHKANQNKIFNGRIVVVKSTDAGDADHFVAQDNLYTLCVRGMDNEKIIEENIICSPISRVLSAKSQWQQVLETANNPDLQIIISNTTEVGIQLVKESIHQEPPASFPAKLLAFLYRRFTNFKESPGGGLIIIPTELITENGDKLRLIIEELVAYNQLGNQFIQWLKKNVTFCNSLVDRIVTKDPGQELLDSIERSLGYKDELMTMCEDYKLWAIQGNDHVQSIVSFTRADPGVFVKPDIEIYKSLKLHLLNGTHTFSASLAFLCGFDTVKQAMGDPQFFAFAENLMLKEIASAIPYSIPAEVKEQFGNKVLDRFRNPFLEHHWLNITFQNTMKMRMRNLPVLKQYQHLFSTAPERMATGFAAYILFMKAVKKEGQQHFGIRNGTYYKINDDRASYFYDLWKEEQSPANIVAAVMGNTELWEHDLSGFTTFRERVQEKLNEMITKGIRESL